MRALRFHALGGPEVLRLEEIDPPPARPGHVLVRPRALGVNFADGRFLRGEYLKRPDLPDVPGMELAGVVEAVGEGVVGVSPDQRVMALGPRAWAELVACPAAQVYPLPDGVGFDVGAALPVQGLTAHHLLFLVGRLRAGERVLVHAASGGVGTLAVQLAKRAGATVVASASPAKHALARRLGADHVVDSRGDWLRGVKDAVGAVDVVLEMLGGTESYKRNFACLAPLGRMVVFGAASGDTRGTFEPVGLMGKNLTIAGYWLTPLLGRRELCAPPLAELAEQARAGALEVVIGARFPFERGADAIRHVESRESQGKIVLELG